MMGTEKQEPKNHASRELFKYAESSKDMNERFLKIGEQENKDQEKDKDEMEKDRSDHP